MEGNAGVEQRLIRTLELLAIVLAAGGTLVDVVAVHQHERERKSLAIGHHLRGDVVLRFGAAPAVADDREFDRVGPGGKRQPTRTTAIARITLNGDAAGLKGSPIARGEREQQQECQPPQPRTHAHVAHTVQADA